METNSNVQVLSKEILKPSSQTPDHLKSVQLSMPDQLQGPAYIRMVFFYQADELTNGLTSCSDINRDHISEKLKRSLSDTLTTFYPLAGRLDHETFMVDCNDAGVLYVEARVDSRISDAIHDPVAEKLKVYLPVSSVIVVENIFLCVQINFFDCGGIAVGLCLSHQIADGTSLVAFMNAWATTCRIGEGENANRPRPSFDLSRHFPKRDIHKTNYFMLQYLFVREEEYVTRRFVFDKEKIAALRKIVASSNDVDALKDPTRVEVISAFLWKHFIEVAMSKKINTSSAAVHVVSLRKRMGTEHVFGNCYANQIATSDHHADCPEIHNLAWELRSKLRAIDDEFIRKLQRLDEDPFAQSLDQLSREGVEYCLFSSWCRFPLYEVDFGWGKPVWIGTPAFPMMNATIFLDDPSGDGIEAWVNALPDSIKTLETRLKLLS